MKEQTLYARVIHRIEGTNIGRIVLLPSGRQGVYRGVTDGRVTVEYWDEPGDFVVLRPELVKFL